MTHLGEGIKSVLAGIMISIGGSAFLSCGDNRYVGATAFAVGLIAVVLLGLNLYTGKIGYVLDNDRRFAVDTALSVVGNLIGCFIVGLMQTPIGNVVNIVNAKLEKGVFEVIADGILCGILIFVCVDIYKKKNTMLGVLFCVPVFILCGFEHSIADMFYVINARAFNWDAAAFLGLVVLGNAIGGLLFPVAFKLAASCQKPQAE